MSLITLGQRNDQDTTDVLGENRIYFEELLCKHGKTDPI